MREYEVDVVLEAFPQLLPQGFAFLEESLCGIEQVADEVCENVLERFALGQLPTGKLQFPPEIPLTPGHWYVGEPHHRTS